MASTGKVLRHFCRHGEKFTLCVEMGFKWTFLGKQNETEEGKFKGVLFSNFAIL
jgi:hypothetical protein